MKAKYKDVKFKSKIEFDKWLKKLTEYHIYFEDNGQDFLEWFVDKRGEVLHSDMQSFVWNGKMIDVNSIKIGKRLKFIDGSELNYKIKKVIGKYTPMLGESPTK